MTRRSGCLEVGSCCSLKRKRFSFLKYNNYSLPNTQRKCTKPCVKCTKAVSNYAINYARSRAGTEWTFAHVMECKFKRGTWMCLTQRQSSSFLNLKYSHWQLGWKHALEILLRTQAVPQLPPSRKNHARKFPKEFIRFRGGTVLPLVLYSTRGKYGTAPGQKNSVLYVCDSTAGPIHCGN